MEYKYKPEECEEHGHKLQFALTPDEKRISVYSAIQAPDKVYACPGCGIRVVPEADTPIRVLDVVRAAHFNALPGYGNDHSMRRAKRNYESVADFVKSMIVQTLSTSNEFSYAGSDLSYVSHRRQADGKFWQHSKHEIDVFARRNNPGSIDVILHVIEVPMNNVIADRLYEKMADIATEYSDDKIKSLTSGNDRFVLDEVVRIEGKMSRRRRTYQNFVVVANDNSIRDLGRSRVELPPTVHNFVSYYTDDNVIFFDPSSLTFSLNSFSEKRPVQADRETDEHNPNMTFRCAKTDMPYFTFEATPDVEKKKPYKNRPSIKSSNIAHWRLAKPVKIEVGPDGKPYSVIREDGHAEFVF